MSVSTLPVNGFLLLGGMHHMLHLVPAAAALALRGDSTVIVFVTNEDEENACHSLLSEFGACGVQVTRLSPPKWLRFLSTIRSDWSNLKVPCLIGNRGHFTGLSSLVVAERTSTLLKRLPGQKPFLIHIPHGAGDRAKGFEKRIRLFDHIIVAGSKDRDRMITAKVATEHNCTVSGYIKASAVDFLNPVATNIFNNERPTVLYNPHFDDRLSSWHKFGIEVLHWFKSQNTFNLIFAPHIRLSSKLTARDKELVASFAEGSDKIHVDMDSSKLTDMSYTRAADIYLGDVSSQVYEFLTRPRPCVFLLPEPVDHAGDPNYAHCKFGDVCFDPESIFQALEMSQARHPAYIHTQREAVQAALGEVSRETLDRAAAIIATVVADNEHQRKAKR